jgi:hypothetical protein
MRKYDSTSAAGAPVQRTWQQIREQMTAAYGRNYTPQELRNMELKWRRTLADAGWSVKGQ